MTIDLRVIGSSEGGCHLKSLGQGESLAKNFLFIEFCLG